MSFLAGVTATLIEWLAEKSVGLFSRWIKNHEAQIKIEQTAKADQEKLEKATTDQEVSDAAKKIATDSF